MQQVSRRCIKDLCSYRNSNDQVFTGVAGAIRSFSVRPTLRDVLRVPPSAYAWGTVESTYDARGGFSAIELCLIRC